MIKVDFHPEPRILRQFGFFAIVGLPLIAALVLRLCGKFEWTHPAMLAAFGTAVVQLGLLLAGFPHLTRLLFVAIMLVALPIGFVLSHVLIAVVYYLVMTPIALVFRLAGRDVIGRKLDPKLATYWTDRGQPKPASSYFKLY